MPAATFRFYAELNDLVAPERRFRDGAWEFAPGTTVKDAIEALGVPHCEVDLVLRNGVPAGFGERLADGDRIAAYPVFEALDVAGVTRVRAEPLRELRFVLDGHLGRLAAWLRLLGFDALWERQPRDEELARVSARERRVLLTRDRGLLKRSQVTHGLCVRATSPREQVREVVERLQLQRRLRPYTRCTRCNGLLAPVEKAAIADRLPPLTRERVRDFSQCASCAQLYWKGAHHPRQQALIDELRGVAPLTDPTAAAPP